MKPKILLNNLDIFLLFLVSAILFGLSESILLCLCAGVFLLPGAPISFIMDKLGLRYLKGLGGFYGFLLSTLLGLGCLMAGIYSLLSLSFLCLVVSGALAYFALLASRPRTRDNASNNSDWLYIGILLSCAYLAMFYPFSQVGEPMDAGYAYRAYFNGDFLKHVALTGEVAKGDFPPFNPYFHPARLHYYWFIYIFSSYLSLALGGGALAAQKAFLFLCLLVARWFIRALYLVFKGLFSHGLAAFFGVLISFTAYSYEFWYVRHHSLKKGLGVLHNFFNYNFDGATRWFICHPQIDGFYRSLIYTPQHLLALIIMIHCLWIIATRSNSGRQLADHLICGFLLGMSLAFSAFVGIVIISWFLAHQCLSWLLDDKARLKKLIDKVLLPLMLIIGWLLYYRLFGMLKGGSEAPQVSANWKALRNIIPIMFFNYGAMFFLGIIGFLIALKDKINTNRAFIEASAISFFFIFFVVISSFPSDVGLKASLILNLCAAFYSGYAVLWIYKRFGRLVLTMILLILCTPALLTTAFDALNSGYIYHPTYTSYISYPDMKACQWLNANTDRSSVVQRWFDYNRRGFYSLIPTFAQRRICMGDEMHSRIFQVKAEPFEQRKDMVARIFHAESIEESTAAARELGIKYLLISRVERERFPDKVRQMHQSIPLIYASDGVYIFRLQ